MSADSMNLAFVMAAVLRPAPVLTLTTHASTGRTRTGKLFGTKNKTGTFQLGRDPQNEDEHKDDEENQYLAHVNVTPSLYFQNRQIRESRVPIPELAGCRQHSDCQRSDRLLEMRAGDIGSHPASIGAP